MKSVREVWRWLADEPHQRQGIRLLQVSIGLMLLFRVFTEAPFAAYLWGPKGLGSAGSTVWVLGALGSLLDRAFTTEAGTYGVLLVMACGAIGLITGYFTRVSTLLSLITFFLIEQRLLEIPDGGDNITRLVLTYMVFLLPAHAQPKRGSLRVWLHNVAVLAIILQVVILYATSGMMKAYGDRWHHGIAMYYISQVEWFSLPGLREMFKNPLTTMVSTYVPMFYQIFFPIALLSRIKIPWLLIGILFHISIAVFMGLVTFSTVMIGLELYLITDLEYERMQAWARKSLSRSQRAVAAWRGRPLFRLAWWSGREGRAGNKLSLRQAVSSGANNDREAPCTHQYLGTETDAPVKTSQVSMSVRAPTETTSVTHTAVPES